MKKFKVGIYCKEHIQEVEVERETDKCVWVKGWRGTVSRHAKHSGHENYFDTWEEAYGHLYAESVGRLVAAQSQMAAAKRYGGAIIALRKPESKEVGN